MAFMYERLILPEARLMLAANLPRGKNYKHGKKKVDKICLISIFRRKSNTLAQHNVNASHVVRSPPPQKNID